MNKNTVYILQKDLPFAKAGAEFIRENEDADYYNTNFANYHDRIHKSRVINNIDWFKPKEEPQWEILEFKSNDGNLLVLDGKKWKYRNDTNSISDIDFLIKNYAIHSVKRLSDGEVFSVGDVVEYGCFGDIKNKITDIIGFKIVDKGLFVYGKNDFFISGITQLKKAPKEEQVPIKVEIMEFGYGKPQENKGKFYVANFNLPNNAKLPTEKYQSIKSAIEDVFSGKTEYGLLVATGNIESYNKGYSMGYKDANKYNDKKYTESELLQARRDAFYAGRSFDCWNVSSHQYAKFEDYINSLK